MGGGAGSPLTSKLFCQVSSQQNSVFAKEQTGKALPLEPTLSHRSVVCSSTIWMQEESVSQRP